MSVYKQKKRVVKMDAQNLVLNLQEPRCDLRKWCKNERKNKFTK